MTNDKLCAKGASASGGKMSNEGILSEEIRGLIARVVKVPEEKISLDANLFTDLGVDSMRGIEIFSAIDQKYNLNVPATKLKNIETPRDIVKLVQSLLASQ